MEASKDEKIKLISGVNLPMVIEAVMNETSKLDEVILQIIESGKDSIKKSSTCPFVHNTNLIAEFPISIPKYVFAIYVSFLTFYR